ncbi:MAG: PAS domain S-box protein [Vicinamibacteria bacterium]
MPAQIAMLDWDGRIMTVNEAWRRSFCRDAAQGPGHAVGVNYLERCAESAEHGSTAAGQVADAVRSALKGAIESFSIEYECHVEPPTTRQWMLLTVTRLPTGVLLTQSDVTAERESKEQLRESESRFRQMAESISDVFFLQNVDSSQMYYVSPAYERIWGRTRESLYANPRSWAESFHPDDAKMVAAQFAQGQERGFDYEFRILRTDGEVRWIHVRGFPILGDKGRIYRMAGVATDITERKRALDELRESERRLSDLLGKVELASVMLDRDARITYCNDYLLRVLGWTREEVIGQDWLERFVPKDLGDLKPVFQALLKDLPETWHRENEILTRSGERRMFRWSNSVLRSVTGEVIGVASIGEDITEQRNAQAVLRKRADELERFHRLSVGRELQMIDLKKQVNDLSIQAGRKAPYPLAFLSAGPSRPDPA